MEKVDLRKRNGKKTTVQKEKINRTEAAIQDLGGDEATMI